MDIVITPSKLNGCIKAIPSKSMAHRILICAAFADAETKILCAETNQDIEATARCLRALGADIQRTEGGYLVCPITHFPETADLYCGESGSTLRFLLPVAGAMGVSTTFHMEGRLSQRPLSPLWEEMERMGCVLNRPTCDTIACQGKLMPGEYVISGSVSSQYITGLLFASALIPGKCTLTITGKVESAPYIALTNKVLDIFCADQGTPFKSPKVIAVEGDWSNAAFFITANALGNPVQMRGLDMSSVQGDRAVLSLMDVLRQPVHLDCADIPDLVPILAVYAACNEGATFTNISRLRLKESDRVATVAQMLENLGCHTHSTENTLQVFPAQFRSCTIDAANDHRIAMAAAIAATKATGTVTILGAQCVQKSYPTFWDEYRKLGGQYEQYIR